MLRMPKPCNNQAFGELNNMGFYFKLGMWERDRKWILPILQKTGCTDPEESRGGGRGGAHGVPFTIMSL